jgi:hypothetical protein
LEDWAELHKRMSPAYAADQDKRYVVLETKVVKAIREAAESRSDYEIVRRQFQITDRNGKGVPSEPCVFLFLKGEGGNLELLLKHVEDESGDYYKVLAVGDKKVVNFISNSIPQVFWIPIEGVLRWIGKWTVDAFTGKATGLLIHAGEPQTPEPRVYLAMWTYQEAE